MGNTHKRPAHPPFLSLSPAPNRSPPPQFSAPNVAPSLFPTPPPQLSLQNVAPPLISTTPAPPNGARAPTVSAPPEVSPSYAPAPLILPQGVDRHSEMIRHHYALIAGAAAAVFLALLVLGILVLKRKKVPEDKNGRPEVQASAEVRSEGVAAGTSGNAKKDLGNIGNSNNEDYVITLNVYSSPGHGRRRTNVAETSTADVASDRTDIAGSEKVGVARSGSGGAHELRTDDLSKSGRALGERNRDARSVRTRNFAAPRTNS